MTTSQRYNEETGEVCYKTVVSSDIRLILICRTCDETLEVTVEAVQHDRRGLVERWLTEHWHK